jgi:hypothetical protein
MIDRADRKRKRMKRRAADWAGNIIALAVTIVVNVLANALPIAGKTTGQVSDKYFSLFTPAGLTFSIWGLIYMALIAFAIYQALPAQRDNESLARIGVFFKVSCVANALWLVLWHLEWLVPSLMMMVLLLATLVRIYGLLEIPSRAAATGRQWLVEAPFSLYLGWISVATIANASAVQSALYWNDLWLDATAWTLAKIALAGAIACVVSLRRHEVVFPLVVAWAAWGISRGQADTPAVSGAAMTVMLVVALVALYEAQRRVRAD